MQRKTLETNKTGTMLLSWQGVGLSCVEPVFYIFSPREFPITGCHQKLPYSCTLHHFSFTKASVRASVVLKIKRVRHFLVPEEHLVCRPVTRSPVIGTCSALTFPLAIYRDGQIKPKSFPQISTNFLLSTLEFNSTFLPLFLPFSVSSDRKGP